MQRITRVAFAAILAFSLAIIGTTSVLGSSKPATVSSNNITVVNQNDPPGNNGDVKINASDDQTGGPENDPHVCTFFVSGTNFDAGQTGQWWIEGWDPTDPSHATVVGPNDYNADSSGYWQSVVYPNTNSPMANGHYKLFWQGVNGDNKTEIKHKTFWVECETTSPSPSAVPTETPNPSETPLPSETPTANPTINVTMTCDQRDIVVNQAFIDTGWTVEIAHAIPNDGGTIGWITDFNVGDNFGQGGIGDWYFAVGTGIGTDFVELVPPITFSFTFTTCGETTPTPEATKTPKPTTTPPPTGTNSDSTPNTNNPWTLVEFMVLISAISGAGIKLLAIKRT